MRRIIPLVVGGVLLLGGMVRAGGLQVVATAFRLGGSSIGVVRVRGVEVFRIQTGLGGIAPQERAEIVAARLRRLGEDGELGGDAIRPGRRNGENVVLAGGHLVITVDSWEAALLGESARELAAAWADNLRRALGEPPWRPDPPTVSRGGMPNETFYGVASWYGSAFAGRETADGEIFNPDLLTAASPWLPFNTLLRVTYLDTGESVTVRVNDRGPYVAGRVLDLSREAARMIGLAEPGVGRVRIEVL